jgi:hypothetical protein
MAMAAGEIAQGGWLFAARNAWRKWSASSGMSSRRSQRGQDDRHDAQAVEGVFSEPSVSDQRRQILVGRGDDPDIHLDADRPSDAPHLALLEHAQELRLHAGSDLADLVEKARAAARRLQEPLFVGQGPRERALDVAEELALEETLGEGAAVDGHERMVAPTAHRVGGSRDQLLSGSGFPLDEHRARGGSDPRDDPVHIEHALRRAHHAADPGGILRVLVDDRPVRGPGRRVSRR